MACLRHTVCTLAIVFGLLSWGSSHATLESAKRSVVVCFDPEETFTTVAAARARAARMFETAGVQIAWRGRQCPVNGIRVLQRMYTPRSERPGALAYAMLSTRTVALYYDRIRADVHASQFERLLAHVLVHEITHILQGHYRHSTDGVMKSRWAEHDYWMMGRQGLALTAEDIRLIHERFEQQAFTP